VRLDSKGVSLAVAGIFLMCLLAQPELCAKPKDKTTIKITTILGTNEGDKEHTDKEIEKIVAERLKKNKRTRFKIYKVIGSYKSKKPLGSKVEVEFSTKLGRYRLELTPRLVMTSKGERVLLDGKVYEKAKSKSRKDKLIFKSAPKVKRRNSYIFGALSYDENGSLIFIVISVY